MTPVDMTMELPPSPSLVDGKQESAVAAMDSASSNPPFPVTALAHPELIITPRMFLLLLRFNIFLLTVTGAAWNLFLVKTAAAAHGISDARKARSGLLLLDGLTPT